MKLRFWLKVLILLAGFVLILTIPLVGSGGGSLADIPIIFSLIYLSFLFIAGIFEIINRIIPKIQEWPK